MIRWSIPLAAAVIFAAPLQAHFAWIVPDVDGMTGLLVFSDVLGPDDGVDIAKISGTTLFSRDRTGETTPMRWKQEQHAYRITLPKAGRWVIGGACQYGVVQRGTAKPALLNYYPKMVADRALATPPWRLLTLEIIPVRGDTLRVLFDGKPLPKAEVKAITPDGNKSMITDREGEFKLSAETEGVYGLRVGHVEDRSGTHEGKKYEQVKHYATLVFQITKEPAAAAPPLPPLPQPAASLGATVCDGFLYVYGGHVGRTHTYDTKAVVGTFRRLRLGSEAAWEELPGGPILQGMNLAAHGGKVYRIGGMQPRNAPGEPADNVSVTDVARYDPATRTWESLPPLPAGRSSHDVVTVGDKLVVVGGWQMRRGEKSVWHDTALILDLTAKPLAWRAVPQPFQRRALTAAAVGTKVYVIGGLGSGGTSGRVDVFDAATEQWSAGPKMPTEGEEAAMGFSPAAAVVNGCLVMNTAAGPVYRLNEAGDGWERIGQATAKRVVARMVPMGSEAALLVGGAGKGGHVAAVEVLRLEAKR